MEANRRLVPSQRPRLDVPVGVFLGIFGDAWVHNAIASIESQDTGPLNVVIAVNGYWPGAMDQLAAWQAGTGHCVTIVQNETNLGPLGSLLRNWDLTSGQWLAVMSQDDVYAPHHISTLTQCGEGAPEDVLALFTSMDGITDDGKPRAGPPFRNAHLDLAAPQVTVPEIIRRHPLPTPAVAFRRESAYTPSLAWYDSGSPDSEWYGLLACRGRFRVLSDITVSYRESSASESRSTDWASRAWQWAQGLNRLLMSPDFLAMARAVSREERNAFARRLLEAIPARYPASPLFGFLQFTAAQQLASAWDYEPGDATAFLQGVMQAQGDTPAARNLAALTGQRAELQPVDFGGLLGQPRRRTAVERAGRAAYRRFGRLLPRTSQRRLYAAYDRLWPNRGAQ